MAKKERFRFRRLDQIGAADAEGDVEFLRDAFVDTGYLRTIENCEDNRCIVVGRTGSGKSALLWRLKEANELATFLDPENLAVKHISNSSILSFLAGLGVRLDLFYRLLWRHTITVEVLRLRFGLDSEQAKISFSTKVGSLFSPQSRRALEYLERWGASFWLDSDQRIKEVVSTIERELSARVGDVQGLPLGAAGKLRLTDETKTEVVARAQSVIDGAHARELADLVGLVGDAIENKARRYYICVDRLDEDWGVDDELRCRMIRALVETVRAFRPVRNFKVVVALRLDLMQRAFRRTRDLGFQEEKYQSLYLRLRWQSAELTRLLDTRINALVRRQYTTASVSHEDVLPRKIGEVPAIDYILKRTLGTPRDAILFLNKCIEEAEGKVEVSGRMIRVAEGHYSRLRYRSLADEWSTEYPDLVSLAEALKRRKASFPVTTLDQDALERSCMDFVGRREKGDVPARTQSVLADLYDGKLTWEEARNEVIHILYAVGMVGLRLETSRSVMWATESDDTVSSAEITEGCTVHVHPAFWRVLGTVGVKGR